MHTSAGTEWEAIPTGLDDLWCPDLSFAVGGAQNDLLLIVEGSPKGSSEDRVYLLKFQQVAMVSGYRESIYCTFSEDQAPDGAMIWAVVNSELVKKFDRLAGKDMRQFLVYSGGMHCELVAHRDFTLRRMGDREEALRTAHAEFARKTMNFDVSNPEGQATLDLLRRLTNG